MSVEAIASVNLKLLQAFLTVADHGSFRVAATHLNRSHSAISSQVATLEAQLGVVLFHRTTRTVKLSDEGRELLECAKFALNELGLGIRRLREAADIRNSRVSLACSSSIASEHLPSILEGYVRDYPEISVNVRELTSRDLLHALDGGEVDFALGPLSNEKRFDYEIILEESLYAVVPIALTDGRRRISFRDLVELPLLLSTSATAMRRLIETAAAECGVELNSRYQFIQVTTIIAMAEAGLGAAILPRTSLQEIRQREKVRVLEIVEPSMRRKMAIITKPGYRPSTASSRLIERVREAMLSWH
ncbi:LysR family transcriptional regulator [Mesorhizobium sp. SB112]|uniref:LysR family transcriptional regulator n=1 Tax=Mesorhizobium sp. SB112 TaxID=3151853 RepID=UPI0032669BCF